VFSNPTSAAEAPRSGILMVVNGFAQTGLERWRCQAIFYQAVTSLLCRADRIQESISHIPLSA
jgi:hypothetical protein